MASKVVSNTGPIIHLSEIKLVQVFGIFTSVFIPRAVEKELSKHNIAIPRKIKILDLNSELKKRAEMLMSMYNLDLGEAEAIALAMREKANYFLTDDLDARVVANNFNLEAHGSVGLILRAFREKRVDKNTTILKIKELYDKSSLFITKDLVDEAVEAVKGFRNFDKNY